MGQRSGGRHPRLRWEPEEPPGAARLGQRAVGPHPRLLGNLRNLGELALGQNNLVGPIPDSLARLTESPAPGFVRQRLSGPCPGMAGELDESPGVAAEQQQPVGPHPGRAGNLTNLRQLDLRLNRLTGCVPAVLERFFSTIEWQQGRHLRALQLVERRKHGDVGRRAVWGRSRARVRSVRSTFPDRSRDGPPRSPPLSRGKPLRAREVRASATGLARRPGGTPPAGRTCRFGISLPEGEFVLHGLRVGRGPLDVGRDPRSSRSTPVVTTCHNTEHMPCSECRILAIHVYPSVIILSFHGAAGRR